jgi:signal transduction histidine kinase
VIEITEDSAALHLSVRDDGRGFDPSADTGGFGLLGMRERVELLDGELQIASSPSAGTVIKARLPVPGRDEEATPAQGHSCRDRADP